MNDRELLELAAKAIGIRLEWDGDPAKWQPIYYEGKTYHGWNPLTDDGDALRLAVTLRLWIQISDRCVWACQDADSILGVSAASSMCMYSEHGGDANKATCRAILIAAAEIGRNMP